MGIVGHNTELMQSWSGNIKNSAEEYRELISSLYNLVDNLVASDFTGGLSQDFENAVLNKRDDFNRLSDILEECADLISNTSSKIESDEESLSAQIQNHSVI